jgi:signal transduction histidine kinase
VEVLKDIIKKKADKLGIGTVETDDIFDSLESTCNIMTYGINRCLDYMKGSSLIALQPSMETMCLSSTMGVAVRCVKNLLNSNSQIIVHPLSPEIHPFLITDKQWLSENILCLLSNAVKYSNAGVVDLKIGIRIRH